MYAVVFPYSSTYSFLIMLQFVLHLLKYAIPKMNSVFQEYFDHNTVPLFFILNTINVDKYGVF
jgi:hypothetical protein